MFIDVQMKEEEADWLSEKGTSRASDCAHVGYCCGMHILNAIGFALFPFLPAMLQSTNLLALDFGAMQYNF